MKDHVYDSETGMYWGYATEDRAFGRHGVEYEREGTNLLNPLTGEVRFHLVDLNKVTEETE